MSARTRAIASLPFLLALLGMGPAWAQYELPAEDPPDRAGRLSIVEGDVALQPWGEQSWEPAVLNRPLTTGDKISTEQDALAEIQVARAAVRLGSDTGFSFLNLDNDTVQMQLTGGVMRVNIRALNENERIEIETPNLSLSLLQPGTYRVEVNGSGDTTVVKVSDGEVKASRRSKDVIVRAGWSATFTGFERLDAQFGSLGEPDEFDSWTGERERRDYLASTRSEFVSPDVTGYQDLEEHGTWSTVPQYGSVWTPTHVGSSWSPYSYGRWSWVSPWGWTWIDDAPWGYAPFHYGRWAHVNNRWCWVPGPRHARAVYAPALVGWNGSRHGYVSWFPLGPGDAYTPDGRYSRRYLERVNLTNTQITRRVVEEVIERRARGVKYGNREAPGAVTTVPRETFASTQRVGDSRVQIADEDFARAPATTTSPNVLPQVASRLRAAPSTRLRTAPPANFDRQVIVKPLPRSSSPKTPPALDQPREAAVAAPQQPTQIDGMRQEILRRAAEQRDHQQQYRESVRRAQEAVRQAQPQPQVSQPAQPRVERTPTYRAPEVKSSPAPQVSQPRVSQPSSSPPRVSQPSSSAPRVSQPSGSTPRAGNQPRANRD